MKNATYVSIILIIIFSLFNCKKNAIDELPPDNHFYDYTGKNIENFLNDQTCDLIILNYWATFCAPCKEEMTDFVRLYKEFREKGVVIIGASIDSRDNYSLLRKICQYQKVNYPILYGIDSNFRGIEITGLPKTFILNNEKKIINEVDGKKDYKYFKSIIESSFKN